MIRRLSHKVFRQDEVAMSWGVWWIFVLTETVMAISPGPAVLFVVAQSLRAGASRGLWGALGIISGNVVWFALSALGLGAALLASGGWFGAIQWLGAAYLIYLAIRSLVGSEGVLSEVSIEGTSSFSGPQLWLRGFVLQMTNPKALVYFVALLPQFIDPQRDVKLQMFVFGITSIVTEYPVLAAYALLGGRASRLATHPNFSRALDYVAAAMLIAAALGIAMAIE